MSHPVRIPADVDREDRVIGPVTARQLLILAGTAIVLYGGYTATHAFLPTAVFLIVAIPLGATVTFLVFARRDGLSMDRLVMAAIRQRMSPQHRVAAPEGVRPAPDWLTEQVTNHAPDQITVSPTALRLPAEAVTDTGVIDLGRDGLAVVAICGTVNFVLRTPAEQEGLVAVFARYLHSLGAPIQILARTQRIDLSAQITELRECAGGLPHTALERAAREHADYLEQLGQVTDLLRRQVLLVLREPVFTTGLTDGLGGASPLAVLSAKRKAAKQAAVIDDAMRRAAEARLARRLREAVDLLSPSGIVVTPLDAGQATAVLAAACNPDSLIPPSADLAGADEVITTAPDDTWDSTAFGPLTHAEELPQDDDPDGRHP